MSVEPPLMRDVLNGVLNSRVDASGLYSAFPATQLLPGELAGNFFPVNYAFPPGHIFRYFTDAQRLSALLQDGLVDHTLAIQAANDFLEGKAPGSIATLGAITGGAAYVNGSYTNVPLTGGAGSGATANITVAGGAVTVVTLVNPGKNYVVGNTLSASNVNLGGAGAGFSIPVATLATGGAPNPGGTLFFPGGLYNINPSLLPANTLRVGGNVRWLGDKTQATCLNSSNKLFGGNLITMGTDQSGFWPWSGLYTVGTSMESMRISLFNDNAHGAIIVSAGAHQYCHLYEIKIEGVNQIGISFGSTGGPAYTWIRDVEITAGTTEGLPSARTALVHNTGSILDVDIFGAEGGAGHVFAVGIRVQEGSLMAKTLHFENVTDGVSFANQTTPNCSEILGINGNSTCTNLIHISNPCNQTVHFEGIMGLTGDPSHPVGILNDVTGEALLNAIHGAYDWSGDTSGFRSGSLGVSIVHNTPHIRYGKSAVQAIAQNTLTVVTLPTKTNDWLNSGTEWSGSVYTPKFPGYYRVTFSLAMASTAWVAGNRFLVAIRRNGASQAILEDQTAVGTFIRQLLVTDTIFCNVGDTIDCVTFQNVVASLNTDSTALTCYIAIDRQ